MALYIDTCNGTYCSRSPAKNTDATMEEMREHHVLGPAMQQRVIGGQECIFRRVKGCMEHCGGNATVRVSDGKHII